MALLKDEGVRREEEWKAAMLKAQKETLAAVRGWEEAKRELRVLRREAREGGREGRAMGKGREEEEYSVEVGGRGRSRGAGGRRKEDPQWRRVSTATASTQTRGPQTGEGGREGGREGGGEDWRQRATEAEEALVKMAARVEDKQWAYWEQRELLGRVLEVGERGFGGAQGGRDGGREGARPLPSLCAPLPFSRPPSPPPWALPSSVL
jgi:hypothetical protein